MARRRGLDDGAKDLATFFEQPAEASWTSWLPPILSADDAVPQLPEGKGAPAVKLEHFAKYLTSVGDGLEDFAHIGRQFDTRSMYPAPTSESNAHAQTMAEVSGLAQALEHVPLMFFQEDFNLDWPQLWQQLGPLDSQEQQQNAVEELLLHLELVDSYLTQEIAARYAQFFEASVCIQELQLAVKESAEALSERRKALHDLAEDSQASSADTTMLIRRKTNLKAACTAGMAMQQIVHAKHALQSALAGMQHTGLDYIGVLDILESLKKDAANTSLAELAPVAGLAEYVSGVGAALQETFISDVLDRTKFDTQSKVSSLIMDHQHQEDSVDGRIPTKELEEEDLELDIGISALVIGLSRLNGTATMLQVLRKQVHQEVFEFLTSLVFTFSSRVCNVSPMNSLEGVSSHAMAAAFAAFDAAQYNKMLSLTISGTQAYLRHCQHVESCIMSAVERAAAEQNASRTRLELVGRAAQGAVAFWATLLGAWSSAQRTSDLHEFTAVLEATDRFANVVESHVSKTISALRGPVQEVCRAGLGRLHVAAMQRLSTALEVERWTYVPVTPEVQECVKQLQNCSQGEFIKGGNGMVHTTPELGAPHLLLDGQEYQLVETVQVLFKLVQEYFLFCNTAPLFVADVTQRILDLLRTFNSKTCQLILGAGAMHIAGLKSITVKHLATACHSLRAVTAMIRLLRPCFIDRIVTPTRRNLFSSEFNLVEEDLRMHCEELCNKIIGIMCERMDKASKDLQTKLSAAPLNESTNEFTASSFALSTVKQVNILSDILVKTSLAIDIELVLKTVVDKYASSLESAYSALVQLQDQPLAKQASTDLEYLVWNFAALPLDEEATDVLLAGMRSLLEQGATALPQQSLAEENAPVLSGLDACVTREDQEDIKEATGSETHEASLENR